MIFVLFLTFQNVNRASEDEPLTDEILQLIDNGHSTIDLTTVADSDKVALFQPYATDEEISETMDIHFKGDNAGIDVQDDRYVLIFANNKYAEKTVILSMTYGIFSLQDEILTVQ